MEGVWEGEGWRECGRVKRVWEGEEWRECEGWRERGRVKSGGSVGG